MKKNISPLSKQAFIGFLFTSTACFSQTTDSKPVTNESPASAIVHFPITTQNTTDPNYESNLAKYKDYKEYVPIVTDSVVKNEAYYLKAIEDLKTEIAEREKVEAKSAEALMKIDNLKAELDFLELYYKQLIK